MKWYLSFEWKRQFFLQLKKDDFERDSNKEMIYIVQKSMKFMISWIWKKKKKKKGKHVKADTDSRWSQNVFFIYGKNICIKAVRWNKRVQKYETMFLFFGKVHVDLEMRQCYDWMNECKMTVMRIIENSTHIWLIFKYEQDIIGLL